MNGEIVLITGASSGVGLATARELAKQGAEVAMVCRDAQRGAAARDAVAAIASGATPKLLLADLSSRAAIRSLANEVRAQFPRIDVLINNAGAIFARRELTVDGIEKTFAVNHLAPFLLTTLLLEPLRAAPNARVITVGSESYSSSLDFANLQSEKRHHFLGAYFRSKLENIVFTYELARRLQGNHITANCLSPGPTRTRFGENLRGLPALFPKIVKSIPFLLRSPEEGARTSIYLATSPEVKDVSGRFFLRCRGQKTKPVTYDREVAAQLWRISEQLCSQAT